LLCASLDIRKINKQRCSGLYPDQDIPVTNSFFSEMNDRGATGNDKKFCLCLWLF